MSEFINTIDLLGDEVVTNSIIDRTITEFKDNVITLLERYAFANCSALEIIDLPALVSIGHYTFMSASRIKAVILRRETMVSCTTNSFASSSISNGTGYIYVPSSLVVTYQSNSNWSSLSSQFRALEDYTVDGTITGELDESKI